jgi:hypothetical protein
MRRAGCPGGRSDRDRKPRPDALLFVPSRDDREGHGSAARTRARLTAGRPLAACSCLPAHPKKAPAERPALPACAPIIARNGPMVTATALGLPRTLSRCGPEYALKPAPAGLRPAARSHGTAAKATIDGALRPWLALGGGKQAKASLIGRALERARRACGRQGRPPRQAIDPSLPAVPPGARRRARRPPDLHPHVLRRVQRHHRGVAGPSGAGGAERAAGAFGMSGGYGPMAGRRVGGS